MAREKIMNYALARDYYSQKQTTTVVSEASAHQLITLTLNKLKEDLVLFHETVSILSALQLLQGSLDFEQGGDITHNLYRIYEYIKLCVSDTEQKDEQKLKICIQIVSEIVDAWEQIG
jgi:flagellar protein FliS